MTKLVQQSSAFVILWEFRANPERRREFEEAYSADGVWGQLFRGGEGHIRTELLQDREMPLRYVTLDIWQSREHYERFKERHRSEYESIDRQCESLTQLETKVGEFEIKEP